MLKTFELKMAKLGIKRILREHQGRTRYDTWLLDNGIELLTVHSNEHISAMTINVNSVARALTEGKDQRFTAKGFEEAMKFLDIGYLPVHQEGEFLSHALYFQPKETLFTVNVHNTRMIPNSAYAGTAVGIAQDVYDDLLEKGVIAKLQVFEPLDYQPLAIAKWVEDHPQIAYNMSEFVNAINETIMQKNSEALLEETIGDWAKELGIEAKISRVSPEELAADLREMQNDPNNLASGFSFVGADGVEVNQDNASVEELVEAMTGVKVEKPIVPESDLPS